MPPRKPSPVGAQLPLSGTSDLAHADRVAAEAVQLLTSDPRSWSQPAPDAQADARFGEACRRRGLPVVVHASSLVNLASPAETTRRRSAEAVCDALERGRRLGARDVVIRAGSVGGAGDRVRGLAATRESLLRILDGLTVEHPGVLVEPAARGGHPVAATIADLEPLVDAVDHHPRLGVCLDTCQEFAAGHDLAVPGGVRTMLNGLVRAVGRGRLRLVHASDSRDPLGSRRGRHAGIGAGSIGAEPFAELFRHPATRGVPVIVTTPGGVEDQASDIATLKALRDR